MNSFKIALQLVLQRRFQVILVSFLIGLFVASICVLVNFVNGFCDDTVDHVFNYQFAHLYIYPTENDAINSDVITRQLYKKPYTTQVASRLYLSGHIFIEKEKIDIQLKGVDWLQEIDMFFMDQFIIEGQYQKNGLFITPQFATYFELELNQPIMVSTVLDDGSAYSKVFVVSGFYEPIDPSDWDTMIGDLSDIQSFSHQNGSNEIAIKTIDYEKALLFKSDIEHTYSNYAVQSWHQKTNIPYQLRLVRYIWYMILGVISVLGFSIIFYLLTIYLIKETTPLRHYLYKQRMLRHQVSMIYLVMSGFICMVSLIIGFYLAVSVTRVLSSNGMDIQIYQQLSVKYAVLGMYLKWDVIVILAYFILMAASALSSTYFVYQKGLRL